MVNQPSRRSRRLLLRRCPGLDDVSQWAQVNDWTRSGADDSDKKLEVRWQVGSATELHYVEDRVIGMCYVFAADSIPMLATGFGDVIESELDVVPIVEIMNAIDQGQDPLHIGREIIRLGVTAPLVYDDDVFARIGSALRSPDDRVRELAMWATTYSSYAEYRPILRMIAQNDPSQSARERAAFVLRAFDKAGVPEP